MRYMTIILLAVSIALTAPVRSQQKRPDFSGKWKVDKEASDFGMDQEGKKRKPRASQMTVEQDEKNLKVVLVRKNREGKDQKSEMKYSLEGKKTKNKTDFGKQESTVKWIERGQIMKISSSMRVKRGEMEFDMDSVQTWSMIDGQLVIVSVRHTPRGEMETRAVYDRMTGTDE